MVTYGSYLVCNEYMEEVKRFLMQFFEETPDDYSSEGWTTLVIPDAGFKINLMQDTELPLTQNMTFEIYCSSLEELQSMAVKHKQQVKSFLATKAPQQYRYHYIDVPGPYNICKVEINYVEDL